MVTGVPPQHNVDEYIASKNNPLKVMIRALKRRRQKIPKHIKQYRSSDDLPNDAKDLIRELTHYDSRKRATVRSATSHSWVLSDVAYSTDRGNAKDLSPSRHGGPIEYLECAALDSIDLIERCDSV
jgi:serine/threonine protein kinase